MHKNLCSDRLGPKRVEFPPPTVVESLLCAKKGARLRGHGKGYRRTSALEVSRRLGSAREARVLQAVRTRKGVPGSGNGVCKGLAERRVALGDRAE